MPFARSFRRILSSHESYIILSWSIVCWLLVQCSRTSKVVVGNERTSSISKFDLMFEYANEKLFDRFLSWFLVWRDFILGWTLKLLTSGAGFGDSVLISVLVDSNSRLPKISSRDDATEDDIELKNGISNPGGDMHGSYSGFDAEKLDFGRLMTGEQIADELIDRCFYKLFD